MFTGVKIESFRGVCEGGVEGLAPISILVGPNNSGKSTVLEALAILGLGEDAPEIAGLLIRRGGPPPDALRRAVGRDTTTAVIVASTSFHGHPDAWSASVMIRRDSMTNASEGRYLGVDVPATELSLHATHGNSQRFTTAFVDSTGTRVRMTPLTDDDTLSGPSVRFVDLEAVGAAGALEDAYARIEQSGRLGTVVKALARSLTGLNDLRVLDVGSARVLHTLFAKGPPVPAYLAGDGLKCFLVIAAAALGSHGGVVLLEEPESFQHPRHLQELATLLHLAAREGTQVILSTHSLELVDLLLLAPEAAEQTYPAVHRMALCEGKLRATSIPRESAVIGRESLLEDLRA